MLLKGKTAVITGAGAAQGIGRATAHLFAEHGAEVALVDYDKAALFDAGKTFMLPHRVYDCDVSNRTQARATIDRIAEDFGKIDILINNAGVVSPSLIDEIDEAEFDHIIDTNIKGNFMIAQAVVPHLRKQGGGAIVCISSIAGQLGGGVFGRSHYATSKAGILGMAKAFARELAPEDIRVNAIAPGTLDNDFTKGRMTAEIKAKIAANVPMGRLGTPQELANACLFLASDMSSYITGATLDVNGGLFIH
ncbi:MAG: SDR family oxidoreductase [Rhodospirillales bacterium]|nr:SDR family oxidoreductase [Rhodospirillales bacterium]